MGLPVSFLVGLLVLVFHEQWSDSLPGEGSVALVLSFGWVLFVPWLTAHMTTRWLRVSLASGELPRWLSGLLRLHVAVVPLCYALLIFGAAMPDVVTRAVPEPHTLQLGILCGPLLLMEISMRLGERRSVRLLERAGYALPAILGAERLPMTLFVAIPFLFLAVLADLTAIDRSVWVFFHLTSVGVTIGLLLMVLLLSAGLPIVFRVLMPVSRDLPERSAHDLRATAEALGFPGRCVLSMRTRHRMVNAALVGPAPWPRYLVLTDGLLSLLDPDSLRGVVAHEVGHAKANHPALLVLIFAAIPLLLMHPILTVEFPEISTGHLAIALPGLAGLAWVLLRALAHRFEYEADQLSAEALGGAAPCARALRRVGELSSRSLRRSSFRHPSERSRIDHLESCERDPRFRARFWRRGVLIRRLVYAAVLAAFSWSTWAHFATWQFDSAVWSFYTGDIQRAHEELTAASKSLPESHRDTAERLEREASAALELGFSQGSWDDEIEALAAGAWKRAQQVLSNTRDPAQAQPWLSLALHGRESPPWLTSLYLYSLTFPDDEAGTRARIRRHILDLGPPESVRELFAQLP